jgi:hypothetical protein
MRNLLLPLMLSLGVAFAGDLLNTATVTTGVPGLISVSYERVLVREFGFEFSVGTRTTFKSFMPEMVTVTPYVVGAYYGELLSFWVELIVPNGVVNLVGDDRYWLRTGVQYRW